jgi:hypothetical protein
MMKGNKHMNTITNIIHPLFALFAFACFGLSPAVQAVVPPPDGGYANRNTAEGTDALFSLTTGTDTGVDNTALGFQALYNGTTASGNTAVGSQALLSNTVGTRNLAVGAGTLDSLTSGEMNTAVGNVSLEQGVSVNFNTALGRHALGRTQGDQNTGLGFFAGWNLSEDGTNNIYIGNAGPVPIGTESNTIRIGTQTATIVTVGNPPFESHPMPAHTATFIAGISGTALNGRPVMINANGRLGTVPSSARFKEEIKPMDKASEAILALKPVTFRYKKEIDPERTPEFGLVAEEVEKVDSALVARDADGKAYTVRYEAVNAMLLNEFLKEHRKVEEQSRKIQEQEVTIAQFKKEMQTIAARLKEQDSKIQKVSARLEMQTAPAQIVANSK